MTASCLVCCHFVTQLDMVFQFGFGSSWISHDSYCIYYECLLILSWVSSGYVSGWWGVLFDPKVSLHRAKKDTSFEIFTFVDFTHFKRDLGSRLHDFFLRISCVRLMNFFQTLTRKRQRLMQSLCSFIPFRKKAWLLKRIWSFQNSIRTA